MRVSSSRGVLLVDKPCGPTSHDIVRTVRRVLGIKQVGHLGTLDPFASGLLPVLVGGATRLSSVLMDGNKGYEFDLTLGQETDTLDLVGQVIDSKPVPEDFGLRLLEVLPKFCGVIEQIPPVYSALKMDGLALYEHMRSKGRLPRDIESKKRSVNIHSIEMLKVIDTPEGKRASFRVVCGKGTYIRSLARDLAQAIGTVGHCGALRRTLVGSWVVTEGIVIDPTRPPDSETVLSAVVPLEKLHIPGFACLVLDENIGGRLIHGAAIEVAVEVAPEKSGLLVLVGENGYLCEVERLEEGRLRLIPRRKL